jgi:hypothetical protein
MMAKLPLLLGDRLLEGLSFFLTVKFCLGPNLSPESGPLDAYPLNFDLYLGDSPKVFTSPPSGALWFVLPE